LIKKYVSLIKIKIKFPLIYIYIFLVPLFPIVQDQWLNIILLNNFEFSYYQILYYLSGFLFPVLVLNNSFNNLYNYKFNINEFQSKKFKFISYIIFFNILILSILITKYFIFSINYIIPQIDINIYLNTKLKIISLVIVMILLLINKVKKFIKKLFLINFFIVCFFNWTIYYLNLIGIDIFTNKYYFNNIYFNFNNLNLLNIVYLLIFEIFYYLWSFISYSDNLSDWFIPFPKREDLKPIYEISIFYFGILIYYFIFNLTI